MDTTLGLKAAVSATLPQCHPLPSFNLGMWRNRPATISGWPGTNREAPLEVLCAKSFPRHSTARTLDEISTMPTNFLVAENAGVSSINSARLNPSIRRGRCPSQETNFAVSEVVAPTGQS